MSEYVPGLVSVIVPVYNREHLVGKTLDSILCQSYEPIEIIAVNDGSTDSSLSVLSAYAGRHPGKVAVIDQGNSGQVKARNKGIAASRGEYVAFLDSDDTWEPDKLSRQMPLFKGNVGLVYCGVNEVDPDGRVTAAVLPEPGVRGKIYGHLLVRNRMVGGTVVVTHRAIDEAGNFDESFRAAENWDLWIRICHRFEADFVNDVLVNYLKHPGNMSQDGRRMSEGGWAILNKHLPAPPRDESLRRIYLEAYAHYYYGLGAQHFGAQQYSEARRMFIASWRYMPNYRDSFVRVCRTLLGKRINALLAGLRKQYAST